MALAGHFELLRPASTARTTCTGCLPRGSALGGLSLPFLDASERRFLERGAGLEPDGRAGRHRPVSPVRGGSAVRFGVSRTTKAPKSGRVKRPVPMISPLMASMMSAASRLAATAGIAVDRTMVSVRNLLDTQVSFRACEGGRAPGLVRRAEVPGAVPSTASYHYLGKIPESISIFSALDTWAEPRNSLRLQANYSFLPR